MMREKQLNLCYSWQSCMWVGLPLCWLFTMSSLFCLFIAYISRKEANAVMFLHCTSQQQTVSPAPNHLFLGCCVNLDHRLFFFFSFVCVNKQHSSIYVNVPTPMKRYKTCLKVSHFVQGVKIQASYTDFVLIIIYLLLELHVLHNTLIILILRRYFYWQKHSTFTLW